MPEPTKFFFCRILAVGGFLMLKRVSRALEQLHSLLTGRGITLPAAALSTALAGEAVKAAPVGLAVSVAGAALKATVGATAAPLGIFKAMSLTKVSAFGALTLIALAAPIIVQRQAQSKMREKDELLHQQVSESSRLAEENQRLSNLVVQANGRPDLEAEQLHELLKLRGEVMRLRQENKEIAALRLDNRQLRLAQASPVIQDSGKTGVPTPGPLYTRVLKVDADAILAQLKSSPTPPDANSTQGPLDQAVLRGFLKGLGIELEPPSTVFLNDREGTLLVRSSLQNLDKVEQAFAVLKLGGK